MRFPALWSRLQEQAVRNQCAGSDREPALVLLFVALLGNSFLLVLGNPVGKGSLESSSSAI